VINRLWSWLFTAQVIGILLALIAAQIFVNGVVSVLREPDAVQPVAAALVAALIGLRLGTKNSKPIQASAGMAALGVGGVWILGARLATPLSELIRQILFLIPQVISAWRFNTNIDTDGIGKVWRLIESSSSLLATRFGIWLTGINQNNAVNDVLVRNMLWLLTIWLVTCWMGWHAAKQRALTTIFPAGVILGLITSYNERHIESLWMLMIVMLLLMGVWNYRNHIQAWSVQKVDFSDSITFDSTSAVLGLSLFIGAFAILTPSISWREIRDYWRAHTQSNEEMADALGIEKQPGALQSSGAQEPTLPQEHLLGGEVATSEDVVMTIRTGELPPINDPELAQRAPRYYWRSVIYDAYVGTGWITSRSIQQSYQRETPLIPGLLSGYRPLHLDVQLVNRNSNSLYWSGILYSADSPLTVQWRFKPTSDLFADQTSLLQADMFNATTNTNRYHVDAYLPIATLAELRTASTEYPQEIQNNYLKLPGGVPERVLNLAVKITADKTNAFDKAAAIEGYLHSNYEYDLKIPAPPTDHDVADYFLFELKHGYCDYYATAMVVLARASGLPARFVSGFATGDYDAPNARYIIRVKDAHSWAEIYFPKIGWVEFEPTASMPEIARSQNGIALPNDEEAPTTQQANRIRLPNFEGEGVILILIAVIAGIVVYFAWLEKFRYARLEPITAVEEIYKRFYHSAHRIIDTAHYQETSLEFTTRLLNDINSQQTVSRIKWFNALQYQEVLSLTQLYNLMLFSNMEINEHHFDLAWESWTTIRWRLLLMSMMKAITQAMKHNLQRLQTKS